MTSFLLIGSVAAVIAGFSQSTIGFGMGLILAPCVMLVLEPIAVVPTVLLVNILNSIIVTLRYRGHIHLKTVLTLSVGGIIGFTAGIQVLSSIDPVSMRFLVGLFVLTFTCILWSGWHRPVPETPLVILPVGMASGFAGGTTSMSGPPVILFLANQGHERDHFRATLIAYFTIINVYGIARFFLMGALTREVLESAAILIPATLVGTALGIAFGARIPEEKFKKTVLFALLIIGGILVWSSLKALAAGD